MNKSFSEKAHAGTASAAMIVLSGAMLEQAKAEGHYVAECYGADGKLKWSDKIENIVTNEGKNVALDTIFAGSAYTAAVVMGLKGTGTAVIGDAQASHASWLEVGLANAPAYSGTRKTPAFSAASAGSKATSAAVSFAFTSAGTVAGCFINLAGSATIDATTGKLYSAGDFTGGSKVVASGDTLNVSYSASL
jgi:hypothetical protein